MTRSRWLICLLSGLLPAAPIRSSEPPQAAAAVADAITLLDLWLDEQLVYHQIPGLAIGVVYGQELIWAKGYGMSDLDAGVPMTPSTLFRIGSVTKVFTATAILQLRDAGKLELTDPISEHLSGFSVHDPFADAPPITVWNLLTHTSGLPREAAVPYWTDHVFPDRDGLLAAAATQTLLFPPGTRYHYSNLGVSLLGAIIEEVSGERYPDYIEAHILTPLGMTRSLVDPDTGTVDEQLATAYMRRQPDGSRQIMQYYETRGMAAMGSIVSSVEDMARFAALNLQAGVSTADAAVLSTATLNEMHRPQWVYPDWSGAMGLGFRIAPRDGVDTVSHGGWIGDHRTHLLLVPSSRVGVIAMVNAGDVNPYTFSYEALDLIGRAVAGSAGSTRAPVEANPAWQRYVGLYSDPWGWQTRVLILGGQIVLYAYDYPPADSAEAGVTRLEHVEGDTFRRDEGELVVFEMGPEDRVERIKDRSNYLYPVE